MVEATDIGTNSGAGLSRAAIAADYLAEESALVPSLLERARLGDAPAAETEALARRLVEAVRAGRRQAGGIDEFMHQYALSSQEGVVLMCLAEALLRVPDAETADRLIADKIGGGDWRKHLGKSDSLFVNASTWGLMLTGNVVAFGQGAAADAFDTVKRLVARSGEPIIRNAMRQAMRILGRQFVLGRTIGEAIDEASPEIEKGYRFSFDMLGEAAITAADADRYFAAYRDALDTIASARVWRDSRDASIDTRPSISVKLSALHPRYEPKQAARAVPVLVERLSELADTSANGNVGLTLDAEEAERLDLSLEIFEILMRQFAGRNWDGLGLAVQAYGRRGLRVLEWLAELAAQTGRRIPVRLVKGAYWDTEIKHAQEQGLASYPVFTRKVTTDLSFLACAQFMIDRREAFHPQFATHNAQTLASVWTRNAGAGGIEFQRLHGMGQALYEAVTEDDTMGAPCRIYAPVGSHEDLLAYLVRRLLENGANTSFVNRLADDDAPIEEIVADPADVVSCLSAVSHPRISAPDRIFDPVRRNSAGLLLTEAMIREPLLAEMRSALSEHVTAGPIIDGTPRLDGPAQDVRSPQDHQATLGAVHPARPQEIEEALESAATAQPDWDERGGEARAQALERAADLFEEHRGRLMALLAAEAGKTLDNALGDVREAVDFLNYYAHLAREDFSGPVQLPGPTGERNAITLHGRGVFACISPWNFPLAIFTGQIAGALAAGNAVLAKPAEQTPLIAFEAVRLMHRAGVPAEGLHLLPGDGATVGGAIIRDPRCAGVAFTGGTDTARIINRQLAGRDGPIVPFIAETGGLNAMIVDSTALPEQAVRDAVTSAFDSAGQRCSALRVLCVQDDVAPRILDLLRGAMDELVIGDPLDYATDVGPVIDEEARLMLEAHKTRMRGEARVLAELPLPELATHGTFVAPAAYEIDRLDVLEREVFGPILHVVRYPQDRLDALIDGINGLGYGLTLGVHTRIDAVAEEIASRVTVGNVYVNRNQIGAVVAAQPFGGEGLSGTGPKAGGPRYLHRFATERVVSTDTTAAGGNAALMSMGPSRRL